MLVLSIVESVLLFKSIVFSLFLFNGIVIYCVNCFHCVDHFRAVYTRENKPRLTLAAAYIVHERNYLYEYKLPDQDKPRLEKAVNVDFVPFIRGVRVLCEPQLIFSRINGPIMCEGCAD